MKRFLALALLLFCARSAHAQGAAYTAGPFNQSGYLWVCPVPSGGNPCPAPSNIFTNVALTAGLLNPVFISQGQTVSFYVAPGQYTMQFPTASYSQVVTIGGGVGAVSSVFTRTGAVVAQAGDITPANTTGLVGSGAAPIMATFYFSPNCPPANTGGCIFTFADTQEADDCAWTSGQPDINCNTAHFTAADVGKSAGGGRTCMAFQSQALLGANVIAASTLPTIASFISSTHITLSANAANTQAVVLTSPQGGCFVWGHPDDANAALLETAYDAAPQCPKVVLAAGYYMLTAPVWTSQPAACVHIPPGINDSTPNGNGTSFGNIFYSSGFELEGRGAGNTIIYLMQNFPGTGAFNKGINSAAAFVVPVEGRWHDFQITGGWQSSPTGFPNNGELIYAAVGSIDNFVCTNFGSTNSGIVTIGLRADWQVQLYQFNNSGCGNIGIATQPLHGQVTGFKVAVENSALNDVSVSQTSGHGFDFACYNCQFSNSQNTTFAVPPVNILSNGGRIFLEHTQITTGTNTAGTVMTAYKTQTNANGQLILKDSIIDFSTSATTNVAINQTVAGQVIAQNDIIVGGSAGSDYTDVAGSHFIDQGLNSYTPRFTLNGVFLGEAGSTFNYTAVTAAKLVLSAGWGSTAANTALSGGNSPIIFTITNSGTGQGASPTITYTFPTAYVVAPFACTATQIGGTNATNTFTSSVPTTTGVVFTSNLTPTAASTEIVKITCDTP